MKQFQLNHTVLYAKGWYNKTDNVFEDLKKILLLDDYTPFTNNDVFGILVRNYEKLFENKSLLTFLIDISPSETWKVNYPTKGNVWMRNNKENESYPEYDLHTAIIYKILSEFRFMELKDITLSPPKYSIDNPRPTNIELKQVIEMFNKPKLQTI